ncbi:Tellurium resistance protein terZ [Alkanindiges hydrocarboniclasticus]|jgi:tellurium resistance protein TerZ|uniref:Tellurium resistance protein terZ n=1 Tax=Alkanindiges hydrocarboniclasticus TaxID=1907941 RepID=A0A1S8CSG6_9GAMM|nr:TerD family protein [Alkanindiges hydrocarboniclasticus]ONG38932.1 Tellurium resistance protein terZ [Alkanindiges hydrocarboniclasticus]
MAINLEKGQKINLQKSDGSSLQQVLLGVGWDVAKSKGFFGFGGGSDSIDLDASCILFDENKQVLDVVYFGQLRSKDGSIQHSGDNLTGEGEGDDEQIRVNLANLPVQVKSLVFTVSSFRGQTFEKVENAFCRLVDQSSNQEIAKYKLSSQGSHTALIIAKIYRHNGEWKMHAIGESTQGRTFQEIIPHVLPLI